MNGLRTIVVSIAFLIAIGGIAQDVTAEAYFNQASKEYVKQDKMQALRTLDNALRQFPGDPRLLKLAEELIKEDQQQQQEEQQQQQDQQKDQEEQQNKDQQQDQEEQQQQEEQKSEEQKEKERQEQERNAQESDQQEEGEPKPGTIAPQDALRMLDALERSEEDVQEKVRAKLRPAVPRSIEKDW